MKTRNECMLLLLLLLLLLIKPHTSLFDKPQCSLMRGGVQVECANSLPPLHLAVSVVESLIYRLTFCAKGKERREDGARRNRMRVSSLTHPSSILHSSTAAHEQTNRNHTTASYPSTTDPSSGVCVRSIQYKLEEGPLAKPRRRPCGATAY